MKRGRKSKAELAALGKRPADLREPWQIEQAARCGCKGTDDLCPCQNENPWPKPRRDLLGEIETLTKQQETDRQTIANLLDALQAVEQRERELEAGLRKVRDIAAEGAAKPSDVEHLRKTIMAVSSTATVALLSPAAPERSQGEG